MRVVKFEDFSEGEKKQIKKERKIFKKLLPVLVILSAFFLIAFFKSVSNGTNTIVNLVLNTNNLKQTGDRVNILLLGIAGGAHDGASLTDTIMVASYNIKTKQAYLISVPRDLWLPSFKSKVNAVYEQGLNQNNGLGLTKTVIGNILGLPIHYALRLDFNGFVKAIDAVGGVDVAVEKSFDDYNYPIQGAEDDLCGYTEKEIDVSTEQAAQMGVSPGKQKFFVSPDGVIATESGKEDLGAKYFTCRYEHISFEKGVNHMLGAVALTYVRSRHGTNGEGSDFARSKRQEQVLTALRKKILSLETLTNPARISELVKTLGESLDTDISAKDALAIFKLIKDMDKTHTIVINDAPVTGLPDGRKSLLIHPSATDYGGAYVLISEDDDFSTVQNYVRKITSGETNEATSSARTGN